MNPARRNRLILIGMLVLGVGAAAAFALTAFNQNMMFFFSPLQVTEGEAPKNAVFRMGGMVVDGSVKRPEEGLTVSFDLTDHAGTVTVHYSGILPDLFREGQGIVAKGKLNDAGVFVADEVLAKHDENYMPPEVMEAMEAAKAAKAAQTVVGE